MAHSRKLIKLKIAIIDYGYANIRSVINAFECFDHDIIVIDSPQNLKNVDKIVMPGVGSFDAGMKGLEERDFIEPLYRRVMEAGVPFIGICVGLQLMFSGSEEGRLPGLQWFSGEFSKIPSTTNNLTVPHIGWNDVHINSNSRLFSGIIDTADFYFAHSYCLLLDEKTSEYCAGETNYSVKYVSAIEKGNIFGVQFHPEKSQLAGMKLIENFINIQ